MISDRNIGEILKFVNLSSPNVKPCEYCPIHSIYIVVYYVLTTSMLNNCSFLLFILNEFQNQNKTTFRESVLFKYLTLVYYQL